MEKTYRDLSDFEVRKLAREIALGRVFTDRHIPSDASGELVFIPLLFLTEREIQVMEKDPPGMLYEYQDKRGPRLVNDLPTFPSVQFLSIAMADKVMAEVERYSLELASAHTAHVKEKSHLKLTP
jgi:hypothetical protein